MKLCCLTYISCWGLLFFILFLMMPNEGLPTVQMLQEIHPENETKWLTSIFSFIKWASYSLHRTVWALPCIIPIFSLIWVGDSAYESRLPPWSPEMKMKCVFLAAWFQQGVSILSGQCALVLHFVKQHNDVIASYDEVHAEFWKFGK